MVGFFIITNTFTEFYYCVICLHFDIITVIVKSNTKIELKTNLVQYHSRRY